MRPNRFRLVLLLSFAGFAIAADGRAQSEQLAPAAFPDAPGRATVQRACTVCHSPNYISNAERTPKEWGDIFDLMASLGTEASDEDWRQIRQYILGQLATIEINKAPAADLQAVFDVDSKLATAIVEYRTAHGGEFNSIDEIKKVPGLDAKKVDARKNRFRF